MGRNKMEKEFSEKLNNREIQPGAAAWDRLDAMLTVAEQKKPKRSFMWLYIAASFTGFLLIASLFFSYNDSVIIDTTKMPVEQDITVENAINRNQSDAPLPKETQEAVATTEVSQAYAHSTKPKTHNSIVNEKAKNYQVAGNSIIKNHSINQNQSTSNQKPEGTPNPVRLGSANADELLAVAQSKTAPANSRPAVKVSAKNLLAEVDTESSETSLRKRVIRSVGKNYQSVKVAVSNRNLEENH